MFDESTKTQKTLNPLTEAGFASLFQNIENSEIIQHFFNTFLPNTHQIKTFSLRNTDKIPEKISKASPFLDIRCVDENGNNFTVIMVIESHKDFVNRAICYSGIVDEELNHGNYYGKNDEYVYYFALLTFLIDTENKSSKPLMHVRFSDEEKTVCFENLNYLFFQPLAFDKKENELSDDKDLWQYFIAHCAEFETLPKIFENTIFKKAFQKLSL